AADLEGGDALDVVGVREGVVAVERDDVVPRVDGGRQVPGQGGRVARDVDDPPGTQAREGGDDVLAGSGAGRIEDDGVHRALPAEPVEDWGSDPGDVEDGLRCRVEVAPRVLDGALVDLDGVDASALPDGPREWQGEQAGPGVQVEETLTGLGTRRGEHRVDERGR